jgi:protein involved in polysaccharide export with SLBB domain
MKNNTIRFFLRYNFLIFLFVSNIIKGQDSNNSIISIPENLIPENSQPQIKINNSLQQLKPSTNSTKLQPIQNQNLKLKDTSSKINIIPSVITELPKNISSSQNETEGHEIINQSENKSIIETKDAIQEQTEKITEIAVQQELTDLEEVNIYGFEYFRDKKINIYNSAQDVRPPENYILGVGDQLNIAIWGYADYNEVFTIEKEGYIQPKYVGRIYLKGLTLANAREVIKARYSRAYMVENSQFDISLNYSRVISVNIVGEAEIPGSYSIPAINTLFNLLAYTGGPTKNGSIRNIQIKRDGVVVRKFDLYKYLLTPDNSVDYFLQNNDYVYIPVAKKLVTIKGEVTRSYNYELLEEEDLEDLIFYAGGLKPSALSSKIQIKRIVDNKTVIIDIDYAKAKAQKQSIKIYNGDVVVVGKVNIAAENYNTINGAVYIEGVFQFNSGERVTDLIEKAHGLKDNAYIEEAYLVRLNEDNTTTSIKIPLAEILKNPNSELNIYLKEKDELTIFNKEYFYDEYSISIKGAVRNPKSYKWQDGKTLRDLIIQSGGLQQFAYLERAYISRFNKENKTFSYFTVRLDTSDNYKNLDAIKLNRQDVVTILSNLNFIFENKVTIAGSVQMPGTYELWKELTLKDIVYLAGGFNENVLADKIIIERTNDDLSKQTISLNIDTANTFETLDQYKLKRNDIIKVFSKKDFVNYFDIQVKGLVKNPGKYSYSEGMSLADALLLAKGVTFDAASNRVEIARVANFMEASKQSDSTKISIEIVNIAKDFLNDEVANNYMLKPLDIIYIRSIPNFEMQKMVQVNGEVAYPGEYVLATKVDKLSDIINRSGGITYAAYAKGATLNRQKDNIGPIVINLEKALRRKTSKYNISLKEGDVLTIPELKDIVTLTGQIDYPFISTGMKRVTHIADTMTAQEYLDATPDKTISCNFEAGRSARYYIKNYASGFGKYSKKKDTYVIQPNGHIIGLRYALLARKFPKVESGATIVVPRDEFKPKKARIKKNKPFNLNDVIKETVATVTSALTLYLLVKTILK